MLESCCPATHRLNMSRLTRRFSEAAGGTLLDLLLMFGRLAELFVMPLEARSSLHLTPICPPISPIRAGFPAAYRIVATVRRFKNPLQGQRPGMKSSYRLCPAPYHKPICIIRRCCQPGSGFLFLLMFHFVSPGGRAWSLGVLTDHRFWHEQQCHRLMPICCTR